jgi:hypothetical protein
MTADAIFKFSLRVTFSNGQSYGPSMIHEAELAEVNTLSENAI